MPLKPFISDFAMTMVPLGFAMWLAHFVFHLFTGSHMPIPVIQRIALDLHLFSLGKPDWASLPGPYRNCLISRFSFLISDCWFRFTPDGESRNVTTISKNRSLLIFTPWSLVYFLFFLVAIWIIFQPMDMRGTMMS